MTFKYKGDAKCTPQFGLIAEEVAKVNSDLVVRDKSGNLLTVRYDAVNAMLLNEFLKEHGKVQELKCTAATQDATIAGLKSTIAKQEAALAQHRKDLQAEVAQLTARLKEQAVQIQKVSAQLEMEKPTPRIALNHRQDLRTDHGWPESRSPAKVKN